MIVDVVVEMDDINDLGDREAVDEALIELARDNITRHQRSTLKRGDQFKIPLR